MKNLRETCFSPIKTRIAFSHGEQPRILAEMLMLLVHGLIRID